METPLETNLLSHSSVGPRLTAVKFPQVTTALLFLNSYDS